MQFTYEFALKAIATMVPTTQTKASQSSKDKGKQGVKVSFMMASPEVADEVWRLLGEN